MSEDKDPLLDNDIDELFGEPEADAVNPEVEEQQDELQEVLDAVAEADPLPEETVDEVLEDEAVLEDKAISGNVPPSDWAEPDDDSPEEAVNPVSEEVDDEQEAKDLVSALSSAEPTHLEILNTYGELSVEEFRRHAGLGSEARFVLDTYIGQGLVARNWKRSKGRYSLTDAGKAAVNS